MSSLRHKLENLTSKPFIDPRADFDARAHLQAIHPAGRRGQVTLACLDQGRWRQDCHAPHSLVDEISNLVGKSDQYVSHNSFYGTRSSARTAQLCACYVDLDYYCMRQWKGFEPDWVSHQVLVYLDDRNIPAPSFILSTGRGLQVVWLLHPPPKQALPRWKAVQHQLGTVLEPFGVDRTASSITATYRVVGTRNSQSDTLVRPTYLPAGVVDHGQRWTFDELATAVLPQSRDARAEARAARARQKAAKPASGAAPVTRCTISTYYSTVVADLDRLRRCRWGVRLPPGFRNDWLLFYAIALAWLRSAAELEAEMLAVAEALAGWTQKQTRNHLHSVLRHARQAGTGQQVRRNGALLDPRYQPRAATIVAALDITPAEMRDADLRVLIDKDRARDTARERKQASRRNAGVRSRTVYRSDAAREATKRAVEMTELLRRFGSTPAIAEHLGVPVTRVRMALSRARARLRAAA